ncbi:inositol monophosphatase 1-like isoform X2 [Mercenaria mercenaria]|nr:inositol monophosphatase 1-like isoform X2 [Mercenaria mercenaria]XP_045193593.1 inositol monophosphatase 1-like isoform X2 [Mercenaria mercenaria]XP_045193594.1 inositol monophosphatase 1-like isoform X2 [Mercenaria mercenaria]XP_053401247.1 inositol monophosphatase 1-like isoform X2 [Mercenaria mercenaria]
MMGDEIQEYFKTGLEVAKEAGERVKTDFYKIKKIEMKENYADLVTETDKAVEDLIMLRLSKKYPSHKFIGEETVSAGGHCELTVDPTWIIDPIDGTTNFVHGIPHTCISIGLAVNKQIVAGIVHAPVLGETYTAIKGHGAFCNDDKLSVSAIQELKRGVVIIEGGTSRVPEVLDPKISNVKSIIENCHGVRAYGSAAINMCFVARGTHAAYLEHGIHVWDIAAGKLIVEEAGGVVCDPCGDTLDLMNRRVLAACNKEVAGQISKITTNISLERD